MSQENHKPIHPKPNRLRVSELCQSLQIIRDSLDLVHKGKKYQLIPIYGQLRALLTDISNGNKELLFDVWEKLSDQNNKIPELEVFYDSKEDFSGNIPEPIFFISKGFSLKKESERQEKILLKDLLGKNIIKYNEEKYTLKKVIQVLSNVAGGSHYGVKQSIVNLQLLNLLGVYSTEHEVDTGNNGLAINLITDISKLILSLGVKLLCHVCEFELYFCLYIPQQKFDNNSYLLDLSHINNKSKVSIFFDKESNFNFFIQDRKKQTISFSAKNIFRFGQVNHINLSYSIDDNLKSRLQIFINGDNVYSKTMDKLLEFRNEFNLFNKHINTNNDNSNRGLEFGWSDFFTFGKSLNMEERKRLLMEMMQKNRQQFFHFTKGNYGTMLPKDNHNIKMTDKVRLKNIFDI